MIPKREKIRMEETAEWLKLLANPVRLCIIRQLAKSGEKNVSDITDCMEVGQSCVSQNLGRLKRAGLVDNRKEGLNVIYYIKDKRIIPILEILF